MTTAAWYLLKSQSLWARWFNVLHLPFTGWHLSYIVIGACLADSVNLPLLGWTLLAFFLGMGIGAHCFDLFKGDPLKLGLNPRALILVGGLGLILATGVGLWQILLGSVQLELILVLPVGLILALGYGLEWKGLHGDWQFALWWAGFPLIVSYLAQGLDFTWALIPVLIFALTSATAQRVLSTKARYLRRRVSESELYLREWNANENEFLYGKRYDKMWILEPLDHSLAWLSLTMLTLALGVLVWRMT